MLAVRERPGYALHRGCVLCRPVLLAALATFAIRVLIVTKLPAPPSWDGWIYARLAEHLVQGHGFVSWNGPPWRPTAFYPVGYPAALAVLVPFVGSVTVAVHVLNVVAATVTAACVAALGVKLADTRGGYLSGLGYALAPGPALWTAAAMTETLTGTLLIVATTAALVPAKTTRARLAWSAISGCFLGLATLVRPQVILAAPFVGGLPPGGRTVRILAGSVCILTALVVVLPWTARNCSQLGGCALVSTNGGSNLLIGTLPDAHGGYRELTPRDGCATAVGEIAKDRCMTRLAVARIVRNPIQWTRLGLIKLFKTFAYEWAPVSYIRSAIPGTFPGESAYRAAALATGWWWTVLVLAFVGARRALRTGGHLRALARMVFLTTVLFALTHAVFLGDDRYHLPLFPLLTSLAAGIFLPSRPRAHPELVWAN